jgi:MFS family permease
MAGRIHRTVPLSAPGDRDVTETGWRAEPRAAWYTVFVLALTVMFAQLDLTIMSLLVRPIKADLQLTDVQVSLLLGAAFAIFYTFIGLPAARLVDRKVRTKLLAGALAVWSVATACCGLAQNYWQLFASRVMVGAGESINMPTTFSLIADLFPRERLPRAIAVMQLGLVAGSGLSLIVGGIVVHLLANLPPIDLGALGSIRGWQLVFIAVGLPGLPVAVLMWVTVPEPQRRGLRPGDSQRVPMREVIAYLARNWRVFAPMFFGLAIGAMALGARQWYPEFYLRTYGWPTSYTGIVTGVSGIVFTLVGVFLGVALVERLTARARDDAPLRVVVVARSIGIPAAVLAPLMPNPWLAVTLEGIAALAIGMGGASQNAALQIVTPSRMRGQVTALYLFLYSVIGMGVGPTVVAAITQYVLQSEEMLRYALMTTSAIVGPVSLLIIWLGIKPYAREVAHLRGAGA